MVTDCGDEQDWLRDLGTGYAGGGGGDNIRLLIVDPRVGVVFRWAMEDNP